MGKEAYYFSHDSNARTDPKILQMRSVYGFEGYGWYWAFVEMMREQENYELDMQGKYVFNAFALQMDTTADKMQCFINDCICEFKLFESDGNKFWTNSLKNRMAIKDEKSEKARKSAEARWNKPLKNQEPIQTQSECNANASKNDAIKESKVKEIKENIIVLTSDEEEFINILKTISNYPLNELRDKEYYNTLKSKYPTLDLIEAIKDWAIYKQDKPLKPNENPRAQINTSFKKYVEWGKCLKQVRQQSQSSNAFDFTGL